MTTQPPFDGEAEDRAIARALDAEADDGPADDEVVDDTLVDDYRNVLAQLSFDDVAPPPELEERMVAAALARRPAAVPTLDRARARRSTARWATLGLAAAAAAAVVAFLFVGGDDGAGVGGRVETVASTDGVRAVTEGPGARLAVLGDPEPIGKVALAPDGRGVLYDLSLIGPADGHVFWLWLRTGDDAVAIGPLTPAVVEDHFTVAGDVSFAVTGDVDAVDGVFLTIEDGTQRPDAPGAKVARAQF